MLENCGNFICYVHSVRLIYLFCNLNSTSESNVVSSLANQLIMSVFLVFFGSALSSSRTEALAPIYQYAPSYRAHDHGIKHMAVCVALITLLANFTPNYGCLRCSHVFILLYLIIGKVLRWSLQFLSDF